MDPLRPFFSFYGAKWRTVPEYPAPELGYVVEPFAGSACYALRYWRRSVVLVERDPIIAELWRYLLQADPRRILVLPDLEVGQNVDDLDLEEAERFLIGFWLNPATSAPRKTLSVWAAKWKTAQQLYWGPRVRRRVARQLEFVRHWTILEGDYSKAPDVEGTWFVDPPYSTPAGRCYRYNDLDFEQLGTWCQSRRGRVIVCEQAGAQWLPFEPLGSFASAPGPKRPKISKEVIWTNFQRREQISLGF